MSKCIGWELNKPGWRIWLMEILMHFRDHHSALHRFPRLIAGGVYPFNRLHGRYLCRSYLLYATRASLHPRNVSTPIRWLDKSINTRTPRRRACRHIDRCNRKKKGRILYAGQPAGPRIEKFMSRFTLDQAGRHFDEYSCNAWANRLRQVREDKYINHVQF